MADSDRGRRLRPLGGIQSRHALHMLVGIMGHFDPLHSVALKTRYPPPRVQEHEQWQLLLQLLWQQATL